MLGIFGAACVWLAICVYNAIDWFAAARREDAARCAAQERWMERDV